MFSIIQFAAVFCLCVGESLKMIHSPTVRFSAFDLIQQIGGELLPEPPPNLLHKLSASVELAIKQRKIAKCFSNLNYTLGQRLPDGCDLDPISLNSFKITEQNYPMALSLQSLATGTQIILQLTLYHPMNISTLILTDPQPPFVISHTYNTSQHTITHTKQPNDLQLLILIQGKGLKTIATFQNTNTKITTQKWMVVMWISIGMLVLMLLRLALCTKEEIFQKANYQGEKVQTTYCAVFELGNQVGEEMECSICMGAFRRGDQMAITVCSHCFHYHCFLEWNNIKAQCAYCRKEQAPYEWLAEEQDIEAELVRQSKIGIVHTLEDLYEAIIFSRLKIRLKLRTIEPSSLQQSTSKFQSL